MSDTCSPGPHKLLARLTFSMWLFCNRKGQGYTPDGFRSFWHRVMNNALGTTLLVERFTEHDLRAVTATADDEAGLDAQELLGHRDKKTTEIYLRSRTAKKVRPLE